MTNIQDMIIFMLPFILLCAILIRSIIRILNSYKKLKKSHERLKEECFYLSVLVKRSDHQIRVFKQYEANYMQLLSVVKRTDEIMYVRLRHICNAQNIFFPTKLPCKNQEKNNFDICKMQIN